MNQTEDKAGWEGMALQNEAFLGGLLGWELLETLVFVLFLDIFAAGTTTDLLHLFSSHLKANNPPSVSHQLLWRCYLDAPSPPLSQPHLHCPP